MTDYREMTVFIPKPDGNGICAEGCPLFHLMEPAPRKMSMCPPR